MNLFLPRLRELLAESGKMQKDICDELGISKQKLSNWKTGYSEPNFDDIIMLAKYFDVSSDYLLGLTDEYEGTGKSAPTAPAALPLLREKILCTPRPQGTTGTKENLFSYASPPFYGRIANRLRGFTLVA